MSDSISITPNHLFLSLNDKIRDKQKDILRWLSSQEKEYELPLYSSVDIRDSGFKAAVVDTNLFPAGFNNLCEHGLEDSIAFMREAILRRSPLCRSVLIVAEEHTRNTWYLENIRILEDIIRKAGFFVRIATFLEVQPSFCDKMKFVELETAAGHSVRIHCFKKILSDYKSCRETGFCLDYEACQDHIDLLILNNDLTTGIPEILRNAGIPIYPSMNAGWHSRLKSLHFKHTNILMKEFAKLLDVDPWLFSCLYKTVDEIDINKESDRQKMYEQVKILFEEIQQKYDEHKIDQKPYCVVKSDSGTYGMGVMVIEDPEEILHLNRKERNKLHVGKSSQVIEKYLIQEGVSTIYHNANEVSEACIYQIENNLVGGFYRTHAAKSDRDNLNSKGATFEKMCPHLQKYGDCGAHHDVNVFDLYRILARIAAIAAHREIIVLEANQ